MTRFQNNVSPAASGWAAPQEQMTWSDEIRTGPGMVLDGGMTTMTAVPGAAGAMGQPSVIDPAGQPMTQGGQLQMQNNLPADVVEAPTTREEAYLGSLKAMLARNVGNYIVATFLVGTQNMVSWEGILYDVGNDYLTIYQESRDRYIVSDYYSLKFMEFFDPQHRQLCERLAQTTGWQPSMG